MPVVAGLFPYDKSPSLGRVRLPVSENDTIKFRLSTIEDHVKQLAGASSNFAKQQALMNADIRILIKEQMRLTKTLNGVASYQMEVRQMHHTLQRGFGRIERLESRYEKLRDEFNIYRASNDARTGMFRWMAENWQIIAIFAAVITYLSAVVFGGEK